ncbi:hypothetical protein BDZ90DRAFT_228650 [Jaminaea rosea]|uniref:Transcription elongation factor Eaf N-terminal domain-containing protein n=1 Tax=Jaminaea rosea TaxID=1569628 RepID=A0A316UPD2_9BASI|nr:hypothetical protein BDZ90DRAFT_228650 [Jaminaea rosea]PWN24995.1 hypothetical protein BDZ90DRAFT_228650 [Jaminaea rosea]
MSAASQRAPVVVSDSVRRLAQRRAGSDQGSSESDAFYAFKYSLLPSSLQQASSSPHLGALTSSSSSGDLLLEYPPRSASSNAHVFTSSQVSEHHASGVDHHLLLVWDADAHVYRLEAVAASVSWKFDRSKTTLSERAKRVLAQRTDQPSKRIKHDVDAQASQPPVINQAQDDDKAAPAPAATSSPASSTVSSNALKAPATRSSRRLSARLSLNEEETQATDAAATTSKTTSPTIASRAAPATPPAPAAPSTPVVTATAGTPRSNSVAPRSTWQPSTLAPSTSLAYDDDDEEEEDDSDEDEDDDDEEGEDGDDLADFARELEEGMAGE